MTSDVSLKQNFFMKACLLWTISDFPAYKMLSGWMTMGKLACLICMKNQKEYTLIRVERYHFLIYIENSCQLIILIEEIKLLLGIDMMRPNKIALNARLDMVDICRRRDLEL